MKLAESKPAVAIIVTLPVTPSCSVKAFAELGQGNLTLVVP